MGCDRKMTNRKYLAGLVMIVSVVWITMIICLAMVYLLLPPLEYLTLTGLAVNMIQLIVAGLILLAWLYSWNMLARYYFRRNLGTTRPESLKVIKMKKQEKKMASNRRANP
jgi:thiol:disulfide interchange protein